MQIPGYPIHWIFDHFPQFTDWEQRVCLLIFDGKTLRETAYLLDLTRETVEACFLSVATKLHMRKQFNLQGIESGKFFKKWGFIRKDKNSS